MFIYQKVSLLQMRLKYGLQSQVDAFLASNGSKISKKELNELMEFISAQFFFICAKWKEAFVTDEIGFYC